MRSFSEISTTIEQAKRSDYLATSLLAVPPLWRASNDFSQIRQNYAYIPSVTMQLLSAAQLFQNHLLQRYENASKEQRRLQQEMTV